MLKKNLIANFCGASALGIANIAVLPLYLRLLGPESYGLVGFYTTLSSVIALMDFGLTSTLSRELAVLSVRPGSEGRIRNKVRTLEYIYWVMGILIAVLVCIFSRPIASYIKQTSLSDDVLATAVSLMGAVIGLRWPSSLYIGGLYGLQKQVAYNVCNLSLEVVKIAASLLALLYIKCSIEVFFCMQVAFYLIYSIVFRVLLWRCLPGPGIVARFVTKEIRDIWTFASGMTAISLVSVVLTQVDKVILIRMLPLSTFGFYSLASSISSALYRIIGPIDQSFYPRIVQLVAANDVDVLKATYHKACQFMAIALLPGAIFASFFAYDFVFLWTRSAQTTSQVAPIVSVLVVGTALHGLMFIPYAVQLAYGWTRFALVQNIISIIVLAPVMYLFSKQYGAVGAAIVWVILNVGYIFIALPIMYRKILRSERNKWYRDDFFIPLIASIAGGITFKLLSGAFHFDSVARYAVLIVGGITTYALVVATTKSTRKFALSIIKYRSS